MRRKVSSITVCIAFFLCILALPSSAQGVSQTGYKSSNRFYDDTVLKVRFWVELDLMLNPIYSFQFSSKYLLNGHSLSNISPLPRFYAVQPGTNAFSSVTEIADQANAVYFNYHISPVKMTHARLTDNLTAILGITHDKLQTTSQSVRYKLEGGGTEITAMIDKNFPWLLRHLDLRMVNLICNLDFRAGFFVSAQNVTANISLKDTTIVSDPNAGSYFAGWGWIVSSNFEIGGVPIRRGFGRHFAFTLGARAMMEGLYTFPKVLFNGEPGYRLKVNNYGVFFVGPAFNFKYIIFK